MSTHSRSSLSSNGNNMYPTLPSVTAVSDMASGYPSTTSAPPSGLASGLDGWPETRRYSGGRLQREAPAPKLESATDDMDTESDGAKTPRNAAEAEERPGSSSLDPALRSTPVPSQSTVQSPNASATNSNDGDKSQENWVENIRVIETLRGWIKQRLEHDEFDSQQEDQAHSGADSEHVEHVDHADHGDHISHADHDDHIDHNLQADHVDHEMRQDHDVAYPVLKTEA